MLTNYKQNLHTHTTYCDGKDTPEEMIQEALKKGYNSIGFSGHSHMYYSPVIGMTLEETEEYKKEITALKKKYKDQIDIFLGLEMDMYSEVDLSGYDLSRDMLKECGYKGALCFDETRLCSATIVRRGAIR